ncbi:MAG TPA: Zn-ribbon domain-containing OB-fold protein [Candidatus Binataceae bacterium]
MPEIAKPVPPITPEMAPFFDGCRHQRLMIQRCDACGTLRFPAREQCAHCLSTTSSWVAVSGRGTVYSYNIMHQLYHPAFAAELPYAVVVIKLDEGAKFTSNLIGIKPHDIRCGMPVEVVFERVNDDITVPKFRPRS